MKISGLTRADGGLAEVAGGLAMRFFPELGDLRVGALVHQPIIETVRLFVDAWPIGRLDVVHLPGGESFFAQVSDDFRATVQAFGVGANCAGLCDRRRGLILVCEARFDLRSTWIEMLFVHEFAHTITPLFPEHGAEWVGCMRRKARQARRSGARALAAMLLADADLNAAHETAKPGREGLEELFHRDDDDRRRFEVTVEGGMTLGDWLAARRAAGWGPER